MANEKPNVKEQMIKSAESAEKNLENTLYQGLIGLNSIRKQPLLYGEQASSIADYLYPQTLSSDEASKERNEIFKAKLQEAERLGIAETPEYTSNYELVSSAVKIMNQSVAASRLSQLEGIVSKVAPGVKLDIPKELKDYEAQRMKILAKAAEEGNKDVEKLLDKYSEEALDAYRNLAYTAITQGAAYKIIDAHRYDGLNSVAKKASETYKKAKGIGAPENRGE